MVDIKQAADKLKKIVAGATIMAGIAMGTGCDGSQQIHRVPSEDIVNDDDENNINDENGNKNDENNPTENNDGDRPIDNNDKDDPIEHNDNDEPIINDDKDDPIEHNDEDNNPDETDDNDTQSNECAPEDIIAKSNEMVNYSQEEIQNGINFYHDRNRILCHGAFTEKEKIDINGDLCIEDKCDIGPNDIAAAGDGIWIDNLPFLVADIETELPPPGDIGYYRKVEHLNKAGPTDFIIKRGRITYFVKNVPTISCFTPNNVIDDASTVKMVPTTVGDKGCYADGQLISPSDIITTKNIQPKGAYERGIGEFPSMCRKIANSSFRTSEDTCYTTMTEFTWLENVVPYLYNQSGLKWYETRLSNTKIEYDLNTDTFRMHFDVGGQYSWIVELPNAKRCLDECYGIDGCEVSITPSPDVSKGCMVNGKESAQNLKMQKQNLKHKPAAPRFIKPAPVVAKQNYVKAIRPNRQKWLAQNVHNFGRNGR